ncbi:hypothetical protein SAMN02745246_02995 [Leeuwenhoekiella marinoflava DSM 3653]|uniref:Outer membrane protein assembly factor BamA n=2 Tax=Leeuwenhoekiella marinoflava TaxID=988 RepID=A0A4Q0PJQ7_9FLAO|nr:hypothetical protein DSL99_2687 [Leeuwenhoekiella marinoflava]SHF62059.1 hypothetical protein SAMN02745246_02995 [Leeuwenhoekiella marinoflava DSM 3653]
MKQKQTSLILFSIICLLSSQSVFSQKISLEIITNSKTEDSLISEHFPNNEFHSLIAINEEITLIKNKLYLEGYFQHKFYNLKKISKKHYSIEFLSRQRTKQITLYIHDKKTLEHLKYLNHKISKNSIEIPPKEISQTLAKLSENEAETGQPLTTFKIINISTSTKTTFAELQVKRKENRDFTNINIKGYTKFPRSFVKHYAKLKTPVLFQKNKILDKTKTLEELDFANFTKTPELQFKKDSTSLYLYIEKKNANIFEGFLGFGSNTDESKLRLDGYLNLDLVNNFNYGEQINLTYKSNGDNQQALDLNTSLPYLCKSPISISAGLNIFRQDSTFSNTAQFLETSLNITANTSISTSLKLEQSTTPQNQTDNTAEAYKKQIYSATFNYSKTKNSTLKNQPTFLRFTAGSGFRKTETQKTTNQFIANLNAAYTFDISQKHSFYIKSETALLESKNYLNNELFRFGGMNNIRGFKENSLIANLYATLQTEYRYSPSPKIYINTILDAAYYENNLNNQEDILYSFGLGTSLLTNAGILKLNLVNGIQNNQRFKLPNSILHLTLIAKF